MSVALTKPLMTTEQLLAMPDDGIERWLVRGELREMPSEFASLGMTIRNRFHTRIEARVAKLVDNWLDERPSPRGQVHSGEVGVRLSDDPDSTYGIDVVYVSAETVAQQTDDSTIIVGVPILAVEISSPSDTQEAIDDKIDAYQSAGVLVIWIVDPHDRTVLIYRLGEEPRLASLGQEIVDESHLPGLRLPVARIFD